MKFPRRTNKRDVFTHNSEVLTPALVREVVNAILAMGPEDDEPWDLWCYQEVLEAISIDRVTDPRGCAREVLRLMSNDDQ